LSPPAPAPTSPGALPRKPGGLATLRSPFYAGVLLLLVLVTAAGLRSRQELAEARAKEAELIAEAAATEARIAALEQRIARLRNDPLTLERLARQDLGLVDPADVVIVLPESEP
jgi:cell division protein FtsB